MAEVLLRKFASRDGRRDIETRSAGTHALNENTSPPEAREVAKSAGLDLASHRAQPISRELIGWADQIVVMSPEHTDFIEMNFPEGVEKIEELARHRPGGKPGETINDPYGLPLFYYRQYFSDLMEALKNYYGQLNNERV